LFVQLQRGLMMEPTQLKRTPWIFLALVLALAACAPGPAPATSTPSLVPVDLSGPEMTVGASWLYADGSLLVAVPAGIFTMGANGPDNPLHQVNLSDFWIYSTKVTNRQYAYCFTMGQCTRPPQAHNPVFDDALRSNDPMVGVDYEQATAYCAFVHARLPTEAEWEKAARGPNAFIYPWDDGAPGCDLLNYGICVGNTTPVTTYPAGQSYYHAFDMEGNALEWAADWYQADYYLNAPTDDPQGPAKGQDRVVRSSAFNSGADQTQTFNRSHSNPDTQRDNLGFRCVVEDPAYFASFCQYPATYGTDGIGGAATGEQSTVDCPDLSIVQSPSCINGKPVTYVEISSPPGSYVYTFHAPAPQCSAVGSGIHTQCTDNGQLELCFKCTVTLASQPQCPDGYAWDAGTQSCLGRSSTGACLPGFTHGPGSLVTENTSSSTSAPNEEAGCCTFDPDSAGESTSPLSNLKEICGTSPMTGITYCWKSFAWCPAGTSFDGQECISVQLQAFCKSEGVALNSCTGGGGGGGNTCNITEQSCAATCNPLGYIYDAAACSCNCNAG